jgi:[NiFe] hydrogenase diaphorase moiety large subunit
MPVSELLTLCGAESPLFVQLSGPSGELIALSEAQRRISMRDAPDAVRCGGAFTVFSEKRDLLKVLLNYAHFFKHESCGVCTPCRAGNFILQRKLEKIDRGLAQAADLADIRHWGELMRAGSRCGLGKTAPNAPMQAMAQFQDYFAARLSREADDLTRAFDLKRAVAEYDATIEKLHDQD